jgi:anaphase-promoting complex subunit 1
MADREGLRLVEEGARLRFGRDHRVREVCRLLCSSRPIYLKVRREGGREGGKTAYRDWWPIYIKIRREGGREGRPLIETGGRPRPFSSFARPHPPLPLQVDRPAELSDHDYAQRQQARLLLLCRRSLSTPIARGMLTLASFHPLLAEPLPLPRLCLAATLPPSLATLHLDTSAYTPDLTLWPEFHNGVAAGLRLAPAWGREGGREGGRGGGVSRTWIIYNRPRTPSHAHGGFLLALGLQVRGREGGREGGREWEGEGEMVEGRARRCLTRTRRPFLPQGHLSSLAVTDLYDYLTQGHDPTTVGVFLGMAASKRGTADATVRPL